MSLPRELQRGATIPEPGVSIKVALCLPNTWTPIISGLLIGPTKPYFWDNTASDTDREAAVTIANDILAKFLTADCQCNPQCGNTTSYEFDFTASQQNWSISLGTWESGTGIIAQELQLADGKHAMLNAWFAYPADIYVERLETVEMLLNAGLGAEASYHAELVTQSVNFLTMQMASVDSLVEAQTYARDLDLNLDLYSQNQCKLPSRVVGIGVDIGPYGNLFSFGVTLPAIRVVYR